MRRLPVVLVAASVSLLLSAGTALATDPTLWGWTTARRPSTASYTPSAIDQGNANGYTDSVTRFSTGQYRVDMPQIENPNRVGIPTTTAMSSAPRLCVTNDFGDNNNPDQVSVYATCFGFNGGQSDSKYSVVFTTGGADSGTLAFALANQSAMTDYNPDPNYSFDNASATPISIHRVGTGTYTVTLPGQDGTHGDIQITSMYSAYCRLVQWTLATPVVVTVKCLAPVTNVAVDAPFEVVYTNGVGLTGVNAGNAVYLFANKPKIAFYTPGAAFRYSTGGTPTIKRIGVGAYRVVLPGMPPGGAASVTAAGTGTSRCQLGSIATTTPQKVTVLCFGANGRPANSKFTFSYVGDAT